MPSKFNKFNLQPVTRKEVIEISGREVSSSERVVHDLIGTIDGVNKVFTLAETPSNPDSMLLYVNGIEQTDGGDYTISGYTITFTSAPMVGYNLSAFF